MSDRAPSRDVLLAEYKPSFIARGYIMLVDLLSAAIASARNFSRWSFLSERSLTPEMHLTLLPETTEKYKAIYQHSCWEVGDMLIKEKKELARGSKDTMVYKGYLGGTPVVVKRRPQGFLDVALKEIRHLIASDSHRNIVSFYGVRYDEDYINIAFEQCACSLHQLILACQDVCQDTSHQVTFNAWEPTAESIAQEFELWNANGYYSNHLLKMMRDVVKGLAHLHELGIIHGNLNPQNVLVVRWDEDTLTAKVSGMGSSSHVSSYANGDVDQAIDLDLQNLGRVLFFCMTKGRRPFKAISQHSGKNIRKNKKINLSLVKSIPEALDLISSLVDSRLKLRLKAVDVLRHPLFWSHEKRLSFLSDAGDRVESEDDSELLKALEDTGSVIFGESWEDKMDETFITAIVCSRQYKYDSVRDLLCIIRDSLECYYRFSKERKEIPGGTLEGYDRYLRIKFPKLLMEVYKVLQVYCGKKGTIHVYFTSAQNEGS